MVLLHAERLARAAQAELVRALRGAPGPRLVATIGRTLESAVAEGQLVPALASALAGRRVSVPSLEARREDAVAIAAALAERSALPRARLTLEVLELVARGAWPGGIRQLAEVLAQTLRPRGTDPADAVRARLGRGVAGTPLPLSEADPDLARCKIERAIDCSDGTVAGVARELGLSRQALYREARRLGAALPQRRRAERAHAVPER
jgi:transcriptional regulator of acetoin/glycerol metabolism